MLPLLSMISPMETGTSSRLKTLMGCCTPFSKTWKAPGEVGDQVAALVNDGRWQNDQARIGADDGAPVLG